jgi:hypothetical protein
VWLYSAEESTFFISRESQDLLKIFVEYKKICVLFRLSIFSQNIARRSAVSNACTFVEYHFVQFDSNQNSINFNIILYFEFNENVWIGSYTELLNARHFQILKYHTISKQKKILIFPYMTPKMYIVNTRHGPVEWVTTLAVCFVKFLS